MDPLHKKDVAGLVPTPICKKMIGLSGLQGKVYSWKDCGKI